MAVVDNAPALPNTGRSLLVQAGIIESDGRKFKDAAMAQYGKEIKGQHPQEAELLERIKRSNMISVFGETKFFKENHITDEESFIDALGKETRGAFNYEEIENIIKGEPTKGYTLGRNDSYEKRNYERITSKIGFLEHVWAAHKVGVSTSRYTYEFITALVNQDKPVVFFIPTEVMPASYLYTFNELNLLFEFYPDKLKNFYFVFGLYDADLAKAAQRSKDAAIANELSSKLEYYKQVEFKLSRISKDYMLRQLEVFYREFGIKDNKEKSLREYLDDLNRVIIYTTILSEASQKPNVTVDVIKSLNWSSYYNNVEFLRLCLNISRRILLKPYARADDLDQAYQGIKKALEASRRIQDELEFRIRLFDIIPVLQGKQNPTGKSLDDLGVKILNDGWVLITDQKWVRQGGKLKQIARPISYGNVLKAKRGLRETISTNLNEEIMLMFFMTILQYTITQLDKKYNDPAHFDKKFVMDALSEIKAKLDADMVKAKKDAAKHLGNAIHGAQQREFFLDTQAEKVEEIKKAMRDLQRRIDEINGIVDSKKAQLAALNGNQAMAAQQLLKPERELSEQTAALSAAKKIEHDLQKAISELDVINVLRRANNLQDKDELSKREDEFIKSLRMLFKRIGIKIDKKDTYAGYSDALKAAIWKDKEIYARMEQENRQNNSKELRKLNLEAIENNRTIITLRVSIAGMIFMGRTRLANGFMQSNASLGALQGALNSDRKLQNELIFRDPAFKDV